MSHFPDNRQFAFTILDDTDDATLANVGPVYELLDELGMRTTKTAWPESCPEGSSLYFAAETLQEADYLAMIKRLEKQGFEIASHCVTMESSFRDRTQRGLEFMDREFDRPVRLHCNHGQNLENVYWGLDRYRIAPLRIMSSLLRRFTGARQYFGHVAGSPYFWGDLCRERFRYVRNFTFEQLDISSLPPGHPYRLGSTPYVNYWFSTSDAPDVYSFKELVTKDAVDAMVANGGYTIISTHLGKGFTRNGEVDQEVRDMLTYISKLPGWFVPVSTLLDHLLQNVTNPCLSTTDLYRLELGHVGGRIKEKLFSKLRKVF